MKTTSLWGTCVTVGSIAVAAACGGKLAATADDGGVDSGSGSSSSSGGSSGSSGGSSSGSGSSSSSGSSSGASSGSSGSSSGAGSSSSSGSSGSSGGSSGSSSGASSSSSGGSSGGGSPSSIYFEQCSGSSSLCSSSGQFFFGAQFYQSPPGAMGCTVTPSGACAYYACPSGNKSPPGVSAGTLTISGGSIGTVTVTPDPSNSYQYQASGTLFTAGQMLTVSASGATVPAFGPESIVAPPLLQLQAPSATGGTYVVHTASDLAVAWSGGQSGAQIVLEGIVQAGSGYSYFACTWDATAPERAIVPQAMLKGLAGQSGYLFYAQQTMTTFTAGAFPIDLFALPYSGGTANFQ